MINDSKNETGNEKYITYIDTNILNIKYKMHNDGYMY